MIQTDKTNYIGGIIGATIGGIAWLVCAGISIQSPLTAILPLILGIIGAFVEIKLYNNKPERKYALMGIGLLWLVIINFIFVNIIYDKLPNTFLGISTGKDTFNLTHLNISLGGISLLGFYFLIKDIIGKKNV